jgi:glucose/arabinose dehydrogenase
MRLPPVVTAFGFAVLALLAGCSDSSDDPVTADTSPDDTSTAVSEPDGSSTATSAGDGDADGSAATTDESGVDSTDSTSTAESPGLPAAAGPWGELDLTLEPVGALAQPIALASRPGSDDLWLAERDGRVRLIEREVDVESGSEQFVQVTDVVVDITDQVSADGEGGLLGIEFSADGDLLYLHYTNTDFDSIVSEMPMAETTANRNAERVLLRVPQPFSNHNGGDLHVGFDGLLYASLGDGGSGDDPLDSGQDTDTVLGALLRIDPNPSSGADPYSIPDGNPFADGGGAPEIWAWGLRNPWRFSFDQVTGDLWIGDVGQGLIEEIDHLPNLGDGSPGRAANLGWNRMEGNDSFKGADPPPDHVGPIHTYTHENNRCSVTGGYVYRGSLTPALGGVYLFADYCSNELFGLERLADGSVVVNQLRVDREPDNVISFGQGPDGEVYVLESGGRISRLQGPDVSLETSLSSR